MPKTLKETKRAIRLLCSTLNPMVERWLVKTSLTPNEKTVFLEAIATGSSEATLQVLREKGFPITPQEYFVEEQYFRRIFEPRLHTSTEIAKCCDILNLFEWLYRLEGLMKPVEGFIESDNTLRLAKKKAENTLSELSLDVDTNPVYEQYYKRAKEAHEYYERGCSYQREFLNSQKEKTQRLVADFNDAIQQLTELAQEAYPHEPNTGWFSFFFASPWQSIWLHAMKGLMQCTLDRTVSNHQIGEQQLGELNNWYAKFHCELIVKAENAFETQRKAAAESLDILCMELDNKQQRSITQQEIRMRRPADDPLQGNRYLLFLGFWAQARTTPSFPPYYPSLRLGYLPSSVEGDGRLQLVPPESSEQSEYRMDM